MTTAAIIGSIASLVMAVATLIRSVRRHDRRISKLENGANSAP